RSRPRSRGRRLARARGARAVTASDGARGGARREPDGDRPTANHAGTSKTRVIGLTGPIGCGKSTVAGWLGELGAVVIDADRVARRLTPPGSAPLAAIVDAFGRRVL